MQASDGYDAGVQYTIRNIPKAVDKALKARARAERKSLNQLALEALAMRAGVASAIARPKRDLSFMHAGAADAQAVEEAHELFDRVPGDLDWFFGGKSIDEAAIKAMGDADVVPISRLR